MTGSELNIKHNTVKKAIVYIGPLEGALYDLHQEASNVTEISDVWEFMHSDDLTVLPEFHLTKPGIIVLRNFDEPMLEYTGFTDLVSFKEFTEKKKQPRLIDFSEEFIEPIFGKKQTAIYLFSNSNITPYEAIFAEAADKLEGRILFIKSTTHQGV